MKKTRRSKIKKSSKRHHKYDSKLSKLFRTINIIDDERSRKYHESKHVDSRRRNILRTGAFLRGLSRGRRNSFEHENIQANKGFKPVGENNYIRVDIRRYRVCEERRNRRNILFGIEKIGKGKGRGQRKRRLTRESDIRCVRR